CQPITQNIDFSGSDQIQTPQYPDVHPPSPEQSDEVSQAREDLMKSIETYLEKFNCIPFEEKPPILLQAWFKFFAIRDRPIFLNDDEDHSDQNKECFENSSDEIVASNPNQDKEKSQDSDIHQLIEECSIKVCEEQKQSMKDTMQELVKICRQKEFLCIHDNVDDLIESPLNTKLLSINSQRLEKEQQEVKNVVKQPAERGNRSIQSLQNFKVVHKNSISLNNTSQISLIHAIAPILSTKEPEHPLSMGYEHLSITPEMEYDEVTESNAENLLPILSECEVTLEDKRECDMFVCEDSSTSDDIEYVEASLPDPEIVSEEENVVHQANNVKEVDLEDIFQIQDVVLREKLLSITRLIANIESLNDNPTSVRMLNSFESDNSLSDNLLPEFDTFCDNTEETRSGNTTHVDNSLPEYDSFCFEIEPDQERLINLDNPSIPRPPPEPPDAETDAEEEIPVVMNDKDKFDKIYHFFMFDKVFSFLSVESEDTIFDPGFTLSDFLVLDICPGFQDLHIL
nr:hypothetical protein [Tanacetum cinerariifolium]